MAVLVSGCGGGGGGGTSIDPNSGMISGTIAIDGPFDAATDIQLGLLLGPDFQADQYDLGRVPSIASAGFVGQGINYTFSHLFVSTYSVIVYTGDGAARHIWFQSQPVALGFSTTSVNHVDGDINFTGAGPYGSIAGTVTVTGTWPATGSVFVGVTPQGAAAPLRWLVKSSAVTGGTLPYKVPSLAYGTYSVGLYAVSQQGTVTPLGAPVAPVVVSAATPDVTAVDFSADLGS